MRHVTGADPIRGRSLAAGQRLHPVSQAGNAAHAGPAVAGAATAVLHPAMFAISCGSGQCDPPVALDPHWFGDAVDHGIAIGTTTLCHLQPNADSSRFFKRAPNEQSR